MKKYTFTLGADPEMFIVDTSQNNKVISSLGIIPGKKGRPWADNFWKAGFGLETDNILVEYNIPPAQTKEDFISNIEFMQEYIRKFVKRINENYDVQCVASREIEPDQLLHPEALLFGCDPDYNAYTLNINPKPEGERGLLRSAGAHIHFGVKGIKEKDLIDIIKLCDYYLGVASIVVDSDTKRRTLYGKAGSFRMQPWGIEYRSLSSFMFGSREMLELVWKGVSCVIEKLESKSFKDDTFDNIESIINTNNNISAKKHIKNLYDTGTEAEKDFAKLVLKNSYN